MFKILYVYLAGPTLTNIVFDILQGFSLNVENSSKINLQSMIQAVVHDGPDLVGARQTRIVRSKTKSLLLNRDEVKHLRGLYTKRQITKELETRPYGY